MGWGIRGIDWEMEWSGKYYVLVGYSWAILSSYACALLFRDKNRLGVGVVHG